MYSLISNILLLFSMAFLIGGFLAIGRFVPEPLEIAGKTITPQNLYIGLFVIGEYLASLCVMNEWEESEGMWE